MSTWGQLFRVTTFGESHGKAVGCVIDGCPSGIYFRLSEIQKQVTRRRPGQSALTTKRDEADLIEILSGVEEAPTSGSLVAHDAQELQVKGEKSREVSELSGASIQDDNPVLVTLGSPICLMARNLDQKKIDYANTRDIPRPGHADFSYQMKYGVRASSGGGRSSARETLARVASGALAEICLNELISQRMDGGAESRIKRRAPFSIVAWVSSVGNLEIPSDIQNRLIDQPPSRDEIEELGTVSLQSFEGESSSTGSLVSTRCPHLETAERIATEIASVRQQGDSIGGVVTCVISNFPAGIGEPCFDKLEAELAKAMLSIPATKGFEIGRGFEATKMKGSQHNDAFVLKDGRVTTTTNHSGGCLGGVSSGQNIWFKVAFKPVSSIGIEQQTCDFEGNARTLVVKGRHDPCVLPRCPPIVEGMTAITLCDLYLRQLRNCMRPSF